MGSIVNTAAKAAIKATPLGAAFSAAKGLADALGLGGGPSANTVASRQAREAGHQALQNGDVNAVAYLRDSMQSRYPAKRRVAMEYLQQLAAGLVTGYPTIPVQPQVQQAAQDALAQLGQASPVSFTPAPAARPVLLGGVPSSPTSAPAATPSSPPAITGSPSARTPAAPRAPRPCAYGPRGADGYCPKRPRASTLTSSGGRVSAGRPCKYGPRGADGYCPKKPTQSRAVSGAINRAAGAAGTAGASIARTVIKTVGPGTIVSVIAKASLLAGAAWAAYQITSAVINSHPQTWDEWRYAAANAYRAARKAITDQGRAMTPQESAQLAQYFKSRLAYADAQEAAGLKPGGPLGKTIFED